MIGPRSGPMLQQAVGALGLPRLAIPPATPWNLEPASPAGVRVFLACGRTDMRKGMDGLAMLAQQVLRQDPFSGALFAFRGRRGGLVKLLWYDGQGVCLFAKRLERGHFVWPMSDTGSVSLTPAQLSMLLEGIDWRAPQRVRRPELAG
jgi:transposase